MTESDWQDGILRLPPNRDLYRHHVIYTVRGKKMGELWGLDVHGRDVGDGLVVA